MAILEWLGAGELSLIAYVVLFLAGLIAGIINTAAGGGSILTLPALIFAGLDGTVANATNRIGILIQNMTSIGHFRRAGVVEKTLSWRLILAGLGGAFIGSWVASQIDGDKFNIILAILMPCLLLLIILRPKAKFTLEDGEVDAWSTLSRERKAMLLGAFFLIGIYAGFLQAGVGIMILVALSWLVRLDLMRGNYIKFLYIICLTIIALGVFIWNGVAIVWLAGIMVGLGQFFGASLGSYFAIKKGEKWIVIILTIAILGSSLKLSGLLDWLF